MHYHSLVIATNALTGMALPRTTWFQLNRLRTGVGRFRSCLRKWSIASLLEACDCGAKEQTVDHFVLHCPNHRSPHGVHGLTVLDDETIEWLLNTCPEIYSAAWQWLETTAHTMKNKPLTVAKNL